MWKKALWIYLAIYTLGVVAIIVSGAITDIREGEFYPIALVFPLLLLAPAAILAFGLRKNRIPILLVILGLVIVAVPLAGILRFNEMSIATIGKALFFVPLLAGLGYYGYKKIFGKT
jgi:hypothetical protein